MTDTHLKQAFERLTPKNLDAGLPGREEQSNQLYNFLLQRLKVRKTTEAKRTKIESGLIANIKGTHDNKTIFVCGVPGTGKTATVKHVINKLEILSRQKSSSIHKFKSLLINSQRLTTPDKIYSEMLYGLTGKKSSSEKAQEALELLFNSNQGLKESSKHFKIVVIDELDILYRESNRGVFYNLFDWPTSSDSNLILVVIANAMDLPERLMPGKIQSRLGWEKLLFESYNSENLLKIITTRLGQDLMRKSFAENAVLLACKRIGRSTGDARRALDICRSALDEAIKSKKTQVTISMIDKAGSESMDQKRTDYFKQQCPPIELYILKCILIEESKIGEENVEAMGVYRQLITKLKRDKYYSKLNFIIGIDDYYYSLTELASMSLIYLESEKPVIKKRLYFTETSDTFKDLIRSTEPNFYGFDRKRASPK